MFGRSARQDAAEALGMAKAASDHAVAASRAAEAAAAAAASAAAIGNQGIAEIRAHQAACLEQNKGVNSNIDDLKGAIRSLFRYMIAGGAALITGMASLIVILLFRGHLG